MTSESTRFLGQPNETKPTVGAVGWEDLLTHLLYPETIFDGLPGSRQAPCSSGRASAQDSAGIHPNGYFLAVLAEMPAASKIALESAENSPAGSSTRYF